ncbi:MAG: hypothetical protein ABI409_07940 [Ramlibacter sp.]
MSIRSFFVVLLALFTATAFAQDKERLGTVDNVQGLVTVTTGATGSTTATGNPIISGMRFVASSSGSADLRFNNGCVVKLKPLQAVTVLRSMTCEALLAAVQSIGGSVAGGSFATGAVATAGLAAGSIGLAKALESKSISSN